MIRLENVEAEEFRRSHCDRIGMTHTCIGEIAIKPGVLLLDCKLCGTAFEELAQDMEIVDTARSIMHVLGWEWSKIEKDKQRRVLLELLRMKRMAKR